MFESADGNMDVWRAIPGTSGYIINMRTGVLVSPRGNVCKLTGTRGKKVYNITVRGIRTTRSTASLIEAARYGDAVPASGVTIRDTAAKAPFSPKKRKCHDCGAPTWDYRCADCQKIWKTRHGIPTTEGASPIDEGCYGGILR